MAERGVILVVDDDENDLIFVRFAFEQAKVSNPIQILHNGIEAIDYLRGRGRYSDRRKYPTPCLMLLDLKMPRCDGFEVLAWRQREADLQYFPVVVFTSSNQERDIQRAMELWGDGVCSEARPVGISYCDGRRTAIEVATAQETGTSDARNLKRQGPLFRS